MILSLSLSPPLLFVSLSLAAITGPAPPPKKKNNRKDDLTPAKKKEIIYRVCMVVFV